MAYNVEKARAAGVPYDQIMRELTSKGMAPEQAKAMLQQGEPKGGFQKSLAETIGMTAGQYGGGLLGAVGGPVGAAAGRFTGGTMGNVAGTAAPEMLRHMGETAKYGLTMGRSKKPTMPRLDPSELLQSTKEGAQASAFGEALPMAFKAGGMLRRGISKDSGTLRGLTELMEGLTGQVASEFIELAKKPRAILYRWMGGFKGSSRTWDDFVGVLKDKGIPAEAVEFGARETTASIKNSVLDLIDVTKATKGAILKRLPTEYLIKQIRAISDVITDPATTRGFGEFKGLRQKLMAEIATRGDDVANAWKDVASAQLAKSFHTPVFGLVPKMGGGDKAAGFKIFYEVRRALPFILGATGAATGNLAMAGAGLGLGALFSPAMMGVPFAAGGAMVKGALKPPVISTAVKALQKMRGSQDDSENP